MLHIKSHKEHMFVTIIIWCILNESFSSYTICIGFLFSVLSVIVSHKLLNAKHFIKNYNNSPIIMLRYVLILIVSIYKSTFKVIHLIFTNNINPGFIKINTNLNNEWFQCLLANAITLTPGTVTVDKNEEELTILWINVESTDSTVAQEMIKGSIETALLKGDDQ